MKTLTQYGAGLTLAFLCIATFTPPAESKADPVVFTIILGAVTGLIGVDIISCDINILFGCDDDAGIVAGGNGNGSATVQEICTSGTNACGQTNTGFISGGVCNATAPPNSSCPAPSFGSDDAFFARPSKIGVGMSTTLNWTVTNATECDITSDNGFSAANRETTGSVSTGAVSMSSTYTLTCQNGDGGPEGSKSLRVIVDPHFREI